MDVNVLENHRLIWQLVYMTRFIWSAAVSYYPIISVYRVWGPYLSINSYLIRFCISSVVSLVPAPVLVLYDRMIAPRSLKSVRQVVQCSGSAGSTNFTLTVSGGEQRRTSKITNSFAPEKEGRTRSVERRTLDNWSHIIIPGRRRRPRRCRRLPLGFHGLLPALHFRV